eukprot:CAMPEP_0202493820 /NCGR_PEP_ID=MMETSP1361-20130828/10006_1 /ASSEMBLY_ACC=CAM_ASM_000849 /TAXON_ID=210615 /ORGANISM="Staurosira complex sp., Strain CCMP2646" /LENGTH=57 /DNA_ID=CAMNT_0049124173 /DNA_START=401 /DNA_END=574 /DNA_ORIENTATION=-
MSFKIRGLGDDPIKSNRGNTESSRDTWIQAKKSMVPLALNGYKGLIESDSALSFPVQ